MLQKQSIISQSKIVSNTIQYLPPLIGPASAIQLMTSITSNLTDHETIGFLQNGLESIAIKINLAHHLSKEIFGTKITFRLCH